MNAAKRAICTSGCGAARRGRPATSDAEERRERLLDVMGDVFRESGINGTTMAAIARRAGMSKRTLYQVFEDRCELFEAYLVRNRNMLARPLRPEEESLPIATRLRLLMSVSDYNMDFNLPLAILRTLVAEAPSRPDLSRRLLQAGPAAHAVALIEAELERGVERGEIVLDDCHEAAVLLKDMACISPIDVLLQPDSPPSLAACQDRLELALRVFLTGVLVRPEAENAAPGS